MLGFGLATGLNGDYLEGLWKGWKTCHHCWRVRVKGICDVVMQVAMGHRWPEREVGELRRCNADVLKDISRVVLKVDELKISKRGEDCCRHAMVDEGWERPIDCEVYEVWEGDGEQGVDARNIRAQVERDESWRNESEDLCKGKTRGFL